MKPSTLEQAFTSQQSFNVVIGYEDYASGLRALELYHRLLAQWANAGDFRLSIWKFEPLVMAGLLFKAVEDAIDADLVIISLRGDHPLTPEASAWMDAWRTENKREAGIALLTDPENQSSREFARTRVLLKTMAQQSGFEFFCAFEELPEDLASNLPKVLECMAPAPLSFAPTGRRVVYTEECVDRWGLNE